MKKYFFIMFSADSGKSKKRRPVSAVYLILQTGQCFLLGIFRNRDLTFPASGNILLPIKHNMNSKTTET